MRNHVFYLKPQLYSQELFRVIILWLRLASFNRNQESLWWIKSCKFWQLHLSLKCVHNTNRNLKSFSQTTRFFLLTQCNTFHVMHTNWITTPCKKIITSPKSLLSNKLAYIKEKEIIAENSHDWGNLSIEPSGYDFSVKYQRGWVTSWHKHVDLLG